jgi:hypothetical protein
MAVGPPCALLCWRWCLGATGLAERDLKDDQAGHGSPFEVSSFVDRASGLSRRPQLLRGVLSGGVGWSGQVSPTRASRIAAAVTL